MGKWRVQRTRSEKGVEMERKKKKGNYKSNRDSTQGPLGFGFWVCALALRFACECFA